MSGLSFETPAQERFATDVLAWGGPRPTCPAGLVTRLRQRLERAVDGRRDELTSIAGQRSGQRLSIGRKVLERRVCDGWQRDPVAFQHGWASVRASLIRDAAALEWTSDRARSASEVAERVWHDAATRDPGDPGSRSAWMNRRTAAEADSLRDEVAAALDDLREVWPALPDTSLVRLVRRPIEVPLGGGLVTLYGVPDLVLDSPVDDGRARALLVDLRMGIPRPVRDREALRFHALLATLHHGRPPFRWVSYHVAEGRSEIEELRAETLEASADAVIEVVEQFGRLAAGAEEALTPGPWCVDCRRRDTCEVAAGAGTDRDEGMSHADATMGS